jgi:Lipocalin-like domain
MRQFISFMILISLLGLGTIWTEPSAAAEHPSLKEQLLGTWMLVGWDQVRPDGTKFQKYGTDPRGFHIFERNGRFFAMMARPDLPKIAASDPQKATPDEARAIMAGSIAYYGTYTVNEAERMVILRMDASTFPNQLGRDLPRRIVSVTANEMVYANPDATTGGGQIQLSWKRAH